MANSRIGHGTTLTGAAFGTAASVLEVSLPGLSVDNIDDTDMDSTDGYREFYAGLKDAGELTATLSFQNSEYATLMTNIGSADTFTVTLPPEGTSTVAPTLTFSGYISNVDPDVPLDDKITNAITIKASGKPTFSTT